MPLALAAGGAGPAPASPPKIEEGSSSAEEPNRKEGESAEEPKGKEEGSADVPKGEEEETTEVQKHEVEDGDEESTSNEIRRCRLTPPSG